MSIQQMLLGAGGVSPFMEATGGDTITYSGDWKIHTYTTTGNSTFVVTSIGDGNQSIEYLVIAGGGGAGNAGCCQGCASFHGKPGGGAGGYRCSVVGEYSGGTSDATTSGTTSPAESVIIPTVQSYTVTVGAGGAYSYNGDDSVFGSITSIGGGCGSAAGGSGGGGGTGTASSGGGGAGTAYQGYNGGFGNSQYTKAGGGSGAGGQGTSGFTNGGGADNYGGGAGRASSITGSSVTRAYGGDNHRTNNWNGQRPDMPGGGGKHNADTGGNGPGQDGIVIIRYKCQ